MKLPVITYTPAASWLQRRRLRVVVVALSLVSMLLAGCGSSGTSGTTAQKNFPTSHVLHLSFLQDPGQPPDPDVYYAGQGLLLTRNIYEGLVQYQPDTANRKIIPSLATSWTVSSDQLTYTFNLRTGVTFHDGTPFTSAAIAPSFARRAAVNGGPAYMVSDVASVTTPSPNQVVINLTTPNTAFLDYLASPFGPVMESPTALAANAGSDHDQTYLQTHDIGTGPYTLSQANVGVSYQMQAYPGYWGSKPYYTTVDLPVIDNLSTQEIQFNSGQLAGILHDLTTTAASQYRNSSTAKLYELPVLESETVYLNENRGLLASETARQALIRAIDVKSIVAGVFANGQATVPTQTAPPHMLPATYAKQDIAYDPSIIKKMVAGLPAAERSITIGYDTSVPQDQLVAEQIGGELQGDGLLTTEVGYPTSTTYGWVGSKSAATSNSTPNVFVGYFFPDADNPYTWTHIVYDPSGGLQFLSCNVPGIDTLNAQAVQSGSAASYTQVSDLELSSGCWLNLASLNAALVFQPWMKGVAAAHVVAAPDTLLLAKLYPG